MKPPAELPEECHCACHEPMRGTLVAHCLPCCAVCTICRRRIARGAMENHLRKHREDASTRSVGKSL